MTRVSSVGPVGRPLRLLLALLLALPQPLLAATIVVDNTTCTLVDAFTAANTDAPAGGCPAGSGADTIELTADVGLTAVVEGARGLPFVTSEITLQGNDFTIERTGGASFGLIRVESSGTLSLSDVTLANGELAGGGFNNGGGIYNDGTVTLTDTTLSGNSATNNGGGIYNSGVNGLTLTNTTLSGNSAGGSGGGLYNRYAGTVTLTDTTLSGNSASSGGGIYNIGTSTVLTLTNTTLSGNSASTGGGILSYDGGTVTLTNTILSGNSASRGGGISNRGGTVLTLTNTILQSNTASSNGGGIYNSQGGTATLANTILSGNSASNNGGGIWNSEGTLTLTNTTVSGSSASNNGGGVFNGFFATVTLTNTTLSGNSASTGGGIYNYTSFGGTATLANTIVSNSTGGDCAGPDAVIVTDNGNNFDDDGSCGAGFGTITNLDPVLADNGGPTQTHALLAGSSAIDAAGSCGVGTDQRGYPRDLGACDSGAFEFGAAPTSSIIVDSGICSLVNAITAANTDAPAGGCPAGSGADTIELVSDVTLNSVAEGDRGLPFVTSEITIEGNDFTVARDGGAPSFGLVRIEASGALSLTDVTLEGGDAPGGGAITNRAGALTLTNTTLSGNSSTSNGGAVDNFHGTLTVTDTTVSGNSAAGVGGGIVNYGGGGSLTATGTTVSGNMAARGGGIDNIFGTTTLTNSTLSGNSADNGGGLFNYLGTTNLTNSTLSGNSATVAGGGLYNLVGTATLTGTIVANSSGGNCANDPITDGGGNLADDGSCGGGFGTISGLDPALADNRGPTQTHALLAGSSAIDAAGSCGLVTDQRGALRSGACDSGAYELLEQRFKLSGGGPVGLIGTTFDGLTALWTEDVVGGVFELFERPIDGSGPATQLTAGLGLLAPGVTEAQIPPDDSAIVFIADAGSGSDLFSVPLGGGAVTDLISGILPSPPSSIGITPDSSTAFFFGPDVANATAATELWQATIGATASAAQRTNVGAASGATTGVVFSEATDDSSTILITSDTSAGTQLDLFSIPIGGPPFGEVRESFTISTGVTFIRLDDDSSTMYFAGDQDPLAPGVLDVHQTTIGGGSGGSVINPMMAAGGIGAEWIELTNDGSRLGYAGERDVAGETGTYTVSTAGPFPDPGVSLSPIGVDATAFVNFNVDGSFAVWETDEEVAGESELFGRLADGSGPPFKLHEIVNGSGDGLGFFTDSGVWTPNQRSYYPLFVAGAPPVELYSVRADGSEPFRMVNAPYVSGDSAWSATLPGIGQRLTAIFTGPISASGTSIDRLQLGPLRADLPVEQANPTADLGAGDAGVFDLAIASTENHVLYVQDADTQGLPELYVYVPDSDGDLALNPDDSCRFCSQLAQAPVPFAAVFSTDQDTFDWMENLDVAYAKGLLPVTASYTTTGTGSIFDGSSFVDPEIPTSGVGFWYLFKIDCSGGDWGNASRNAVLP